MLKNFINTLRCYTTSSVLNIIGLSVAFAAFIVIMMQVAFNYTIMARQPKIPLNH